VPKSKFQNKIIIWQQDAEPEKVLWYLEHWELLCDELLVLIACIACVYVLPFELLVDRNPDIVRMHTNFLYHQFSTHWGFICNNEALSIFNPFVFNHWFQVFISYSINQSSNHLLLLFFLLYDCANYLFIYFCIEMLLIIWHLLNLLSTLLYSTEISFWNLFE
jgi:hypothetical protein